MSDILVLAGVAVLGVPTVAIFVVWYCQAWYEAIRYRRREAAVFAWLMTGGLLVIAGVALRD